MGQHLRSTNNTLKSVLSCSKLGNFADANMLVRKVRDDLFQYLYISEASENIKGLTTEEMKQILQGDIFSEKLYEAVMLHSAILSSGVRKDSDDKAVDAWFSNISANGTYRKYLDNNNYWNYLNNNKIVSECIKKHNLKKEWNTLNRNQNNYVHSNGIQFITDNNISNPCYFERGKRLLEQTCDDIDLIFSYFLMILILIKPNYIMSSDYIDYLEAVWPRRITHNTG